MGQRVWYRTGDIALVLDDFASNLASALDQLCDLVWVTYPVWDSLYLSWNGKTKPSFAGFFFFPMKWENLNEELSIKRCLTNTGFWISQETETLLNVLFKLSSCKRWDMRTSRWDCGLLVQQRFTDFGWVLAGWETWAEGISYSLLCYSTSNP